MDKQAKRKSSVLIISALFLLLSIALLSPYQLHGWGSMDRLQTLVNWGTLVWSTHKYILKEAFGVLKNDPVFEVLVFPSLKQIMAHEGVSLRELGPGPDGKKRSFYDEHYYNPSLYGEENRGKAPKSIARWYKELAQTISIPQLSRDSNPAKAAAYSAHYIADMNVPFHVNGAPRDMIKAIRKEQGGADADKVILNEAIFSGFHMCYACFGFDITNNFKWAVDGYIEKKASKWVNWFDPYMNNSIFGSATSSHTYWEIDAYIMHSPIPYPAYHNLWQNSSVTSFDEPLRLQGIAAETFGKKVAGLTRANSEYFINHISKAIQNSIYSVYTLWRASISALQLNMETSKKPGGGVSVTPIVVNRAVETVKDVRVRLTVLNPQKEKTFQEIMALGEIPGKQSYLNNRSWEISSPVKKSEMVLEAVGLFEKTPDFQYTMIQQVQEDVIRYSGKVLWLERKRLFIPPEFKIPPKYLSVRDERPTLVELFPPDDEGIGRMKMTMTVNREVIIRANYGQFHWEKVPFGKIEEWFPRVYEYKSPKKVILWGSYDSKKGGFTIEDSRIGWIYGTINENNLTGKEAERQEEDPRYWEPYRYVKVVKFSLTREGEKK